MGELRPRTVRCLWCDEQVVLPAVDVADVALFCGPTHQTKFQRKRRATRDLVCPRPDKRKYSTGRVAQDRLDSLREQRKTDESMAAYRCWCGWWHIGRPKMTAEQAAGVKLSARR